MSIHPDAQRAAQAELDRVVGPDRFPTLDDRDKLVFVNALLKEVLRWMTPVPLGLSHCMVEDDELCGYFIPKGTILMANIWSAHPPCMSSCIDSRLTPLKLGIACMTR